MIQKLKYYFLIAFMPLMFSLAPLLTPSLASAKCEGVSSDIASGANSASGSKATDSNNIDCGADKVGTNGIKHLGNQIVNFFSIIVGIAAIIMIIYSGFRYITSGGDSTRITSAKNALIYALIGLAIAALAQLIVKFVLNETSTVGTTPTP